MKALKLILSSLLLIVWFAATIILALISILFILPLAALILFPELLILWFAPAFLLLVYGGWIDPPTEEWVDDILIDLENQEDYH